MEGSYIFTYVFPTKSTTILSTCSPSSVLLPHIAHKAFTKGRKIPLVLDEMVRTAGIKRVLLETKL